MHAHIEIYPGKNIDLLHEWSLLQNDTDRLVKLYVTEIDGKLYLALITESTLTPHIGYVTDKSLKELTELSAEQALNLFNKLEKQKGVMPIFS